MKKLAALGPGLLMAGAAIGVSHLVQSTRAGAEFELKLLWLVLFANLIKYPLFKIGHLYTSETRTNLLTGYLKLGKGYLGLFLVLNIFIGFITLAAVTLVTAGIMASLFGISVNGSAAVLLVLSFALIFGGGYQGVENTIKVFLILLCISSLGAFSAAVLGWERPDIDIPVPGIVFMLALMGWMPAPIECSIWQSLWLEEKLKGGAKLTRKDILFDFNFSYALTTIMAVVFLTLGAAVMFGSGQEFSNSPVTFSVQLVELFSTVLGSWVAPIVAVCAFAAMLSTTLTVADAYPRSVSKAAELLGVNSLTFRRLFILISAGAMVVIAAFSTKLKTLVDIVTIISFLSAPLFAWMNIRLCKTLNESKLFIISCYLGLAYFVLFSLMFLIYAQS